MDDSSVLFTSLVGGKAAFDATSESPMLNDVLGATPTEWEMTLLDSARTEFTVSHEHTLNEHVVAFDYAGAVVGENEYISVMVVDDSNNITHYAKVAKVTASSETATLTLPASFTAGSVVHLKIFDEQVTKAICQTSPVLL